MRLPLKTTERAVNDTGEKRKADDTGAGGYSELGLGNVSSTGSFALSLTYIVKADCAVCRER